MLVKFLNFGICQSPFIFILLLTNQVPDILSFHDIGLQLNAIFEKFYKNSKSCISLKTFPFGSPPSNYAHSKCTP